MARIRIPLNNFSFGEVSPSLTSRTDSPVYTSAAESLKNFFIRAEGGVINRPGTQRIYNFTQTYTIPSCTITVSDYANIAVGSQIKMTLGDGTDIILEFETAGSSSPSASVGNKYFVRANANNNTTADNIFTALNAVSGLTVANPAAAEVTVTRDGFNTDNLKVVTTDSTRLAVTDFVFVAQEIRLEPFVFSDDEKYIIAFSNAKIECFQISPTTGAISLVQTLTADVDSNAVPITASNLNQFTFAQRGDFMFLCHHDFLCRELVRTALTTFELRIFDFDTSLDGNKVFQPYYNFQPTGVTLASSATSGTGVTLTSSASYFVSGHVGVRLQIGETEATITGFTSATQVTANLHGTLSTQLDIDALRTKKDTTAVEVTHAQHGLANGASITIAEAGGVGGIAASNINGSRTISRIIDENKYEFTAGASATSEADGGGSPTITSGAATTEWYEAAYNAVRGFPQAITFHEDRLWFAGTPSQPDALWASRSGFYFDFNIGKGEDGDAIALDANVGVTNEIRHIVSNRDLQVFSSQGEFFIPAFTDQPVTPAKAKISQQTPVGTGFMKAQSVDGATMFAQATGTAIREYLFTDRENAYTSRQISLLSKHLIQNPVQLAVVQGSLSRPGSYGMFLMDNGEIAVFHSLRAEERAGWMRWTTEGRFHSVCAVGEDLYAVCVRDDGGGTRKFYLEKFNTTMNMDFGDTFIGSAGVFTVSSHFSNGATVEVVDGTEFLGTFTVASGQVDVSAIKATSNEVQIGYKFTPEIQTLPLDAQVPGGPLTGEPRKITKVGLDLQDTLSVSVNGTPMILRTVQQNQASSISAITGKEEFRVLGYSRDPRVTISQDAPLDVQINGMVVEVAF